MHFSLLPPGITAPVSVVCALYGTYSSGRQFMRR